MLGSSNKAFRFLALLACPSIAFFSPSKANATLIFEFIQQGSDVVLKGSGSLSGLPAPSQTITGLSPNNIQPSGGYLLLGNAQLLPYNLYSISGPLNFGNGGSKSLILNSSSHSHLSLQGTSSFTGYTSVFALDNTYAQGSPISFLGTFTNTTLASLGLSSTTGLLGTWTIGSDSIKLYAGPAPTNVPGPLPLLGASAAFGFSRRLRSRLQRSQSPIQI